LTRDAAEGPTAGAELDELLDFVAMVHSCRF
jgi:hypothetical protein